MEWTYLGHAAWHVRAGALRLLFDPILDDPHHGGTYAVWPARTLVAEALRPDFLFISHAHADHFDVRSSWRLAQLDPDTVVVTPDPLVEHVARRVGFRTVHRVAAGHAIDLDGDVRVVLTPSHATEPEWGAIVETRDGAVWNQVDTVLANAAEVRAVLAAARPGRPPLDLALVRWAPLLEIQAQIPGSLEFPYAVYDDLLDMVGATEARAVVPSAAGQRHVGDAAWLDAITLPISERRFLRDLEVRMPATAALASQVGATYRVSAGETTVDPTGGRAWVRVASAEADPRRFRPIEIPALRDTTPTHEAERAWAELERWISHDLAPAVWRALADLAAAPIRLGLSVVLSGETRDWTLTASRDTCDVAPGDAGDPDVFNAVTAAALRDVLAGRRSWGDVLLAGELRASAPAFRVDARGLTRLPIAPVFLYYAVPYAEAARRAVLAELDAVLRGEPPPWLRPACDEARRR